MWQVILSVLLIHGFLASDSEAKSYGKCELAVELATKHNIPMDEIPHWVCIAQYESTYDTTAVGYNAWDGSRDYGLFQINDRYWCSPPDDQNSCWMDCNDLINDDITDDVRCARKIHRIHQRHQGNGFMAWVAWRTWCQGEDLTNFVSHCFNNTSRNDIDMNNKEDQDSENHLATLNSQKTEETDPQTPTEPSETEDKPTGQPNLIQLQPIPLIFVPLPGQVHLINTAIYSQPDQHSLQAQESSYSNYKRLQPQSHQYYTPAPQHLFFKTRPLSWYRALFSKPAGNFVEESVDEDLMMS